MSLIKGIWMLLFVLLLGGAVALSMWGIPAPSAQVERIVSDETLPH